MKRTFALCVAAALLLLAVSVCIRNGEKKELLVAPTTAASPAETVSPYRPDSVSRFASLLAEYRFFEEGESAHGERQQQIDGWMCYLCFQQMREAYDVLNDTERDSVCSPACASDLPTGIKVESGVTVLSINDHKFVTGNLRRDFEEYLRTAYCETDYMGAWGIFYDGTSDSLKVRYENALRERGLLVFNFR
ncbi:MAG: hypothetical protein V1907_04560 [Candidatus Kerfeldbacteria bacterium]